MGVWAKMLLNDVAFAANTQDLNVPADYIKYVDIMLSCLQNGTTAPTKDEIKAGCPTIIAKLGGIRIANISLADLIALNGLWLMRTPLLVQAGGGDNRAGIIGPARLPLYITKRGRELSLQFAYAAVTNADDQTLHAKYTYQDSDFPERGNLHYAIETFTSTGQANQRLNISRVGAKLVGILCYSDHDGMAAGPPAEPEVSELDLIVDNRVVYSDNWMTRGDERANVDAADDTTEGAEQDNYQWISFEQQPWAADDLWTIIRNTVHFSGGSGQTGTLRLICVYAEP